MSRGTEEAFSSSEASSSPLLLQNNAKKSPMGVEESEVETVSMMLRYKTPEYTLYTPSVERRGPTACLCSGPLQLTDHNRQTSQRPLGGRISNEVGGDDVHEGGATASSN